MSLPNNCTSQVDFYFVNVLYYFNCNQFNHDKTRSKVTLFSLYHCNYVYIVKVLADNLLYITFYNFSLDKLIIHLYNYCLNKAINTFIPKKRVSPYCLPPWYSSKLKLLLRQKKIAHLLYKKFNNIPDYKRVSRLRANCKRTAKLDYKIILIKCNNYLSNKTRNLFENMLITVEMIIQYQISLLSTQLCPLIMDKILLIYLLNFSFKNHPQPNKLTTNIGT